MGRWCAPQTADEALESLSAAGIPAGPVLSPQGALDHPQVRAMGLFEPVAYPGLAEPAQLARVPVALSETPGDIRLPPPTAGQHTHELLAELGFSARQIELFARDGAT
jgi:crotonobetainyl-CoA:carnitine CoA-transferase CaiB-like acyl-CoA transferase